LYSLTFSEPFEEAGDRTLDEPIDEAGTPLLEIFPATAFNAPECSGFDCINLLKNIARYIFMARHGIKMG